MSKPTYRDFISNWSSEILEILVESTEYPNDSYSFGQFTDSSWNGTYHYIKESSHTLNYDDSDFFGAYMYGESYKLICEYYRLEGTSHWLVVAKNFFIKNWNGRHNYGVFLIDYADSAQSCNWKPWRNSYSAFWVGDDRGVFYENAPVECSLDVNSELPNIPIIDTQSVDTFLVQVATDSEFANVVYAETFSDINYVLQYVFNEGSYFIRLAEVFANDELSEWNVKPLNVSYQVSSESYQFDFSLSKTSLPNVENACTISSAGGGIGVIRMQFCGSMKSAYSGFYRRGTKNGSVYDYEKVDNSKIVLSTRNEYGGGSSSQWFLYDDTKYYYYEYAILQQCNYNYQIRYPNPAAANTFFFAWEWDTAAHSFCTADTTHYPKLLDDKRYKVNAGNYVDIDGDIFKVALPKSTKEYQITAEQKTSLGSWVAKTKPIYVSQINEPLAKVDTSDKAAVKIEWSSGNLQIPSQYIYNNYENICVWNTDTTDYYYTYDSASNSKYIVFVCVYLEAGVQVEFQGKTVDLDSGAENTYNYPCVYGPDGAVILNPGYNDYYSGNFSFTPTISGIHYIGLTNSSLYEGYGGYVYYTWKFSLSLKPSKILTNFYPFSGTGRYRYRVDEDVALNKWSDETTARSAIKDYSGNNIYDAANLLIPENRKVILMNIATGDKYLWDGIKQVETLALFANESTVFTQHKLEVQEKDSSGGWSRTGSMMFLVEKLESEQSDENTVKVPEGYFITMRHDETGKEYLWNGKNLLPDAKTNLILE